MPYSADAFRRAAALHAEMRDKDLASAIGVLDQAIAPFGVRYYQIIQGDTQLPSHRRFTPLIDKAPTAVMFGAAAARHAAINEVAVELLRAGRCFDTDTAVVDDVWKSLLETLMEEHRQIGGAEYFITTPLWENDKIAGFSSYFFERAPDQRDEIMALLNVVSQSVYDHLRAPAINLDSASPLTARQREALEYCAHGKSDWDIGVLMNVATVTAHEHIEAAKRRLGVKTRIQAVLAAYKNGWIEV